MLVAFSIVAIVVALFLPKEIEARRIIKNNRAIRERLRRTVTLNDADSIFTVCCHWLELHKSTTLPTVQRWAYVKRI